MNLWDAAKIVDVNKKTLDDYLLLIKKGYKYGFDFSAHINDKNGVLRAFVKKAKSQAESKMQSNGSHTEDIDDF